MKQIRKILIIKLSDNGASIRTIAQATQVSRPVVKNYLDLLTSRPLSLIKLSEMNDEALKAHLGLDNSAVQETDENQLVNKWLETHISSLNKIGMTRRLLHEQFCEQYPEGLRYSQFCFVIQQRYQTPEASALLDHKAGDKMYLDFTGQKLHWKDTKGQTYVEEIFLSVLGASSYFFALPVPSQKQDDFAWAVEQSFVFYGGVPRAVVPDCLKSAVLKNDGHESVINPLFQRLMDHYGTLCLPARPKHPKDKPLVEGAVNLVYRQILARIDGLVFENRNDMLVWWKAAVGRVNTLPFQKLPGSRLSRFMAIDKCALKPLPTASFDLTAVLNQTVATTGVVYLNDDKTSYSVPSSLQGMKVEILVTPTHVEIWHEGERRAMHERQCGAGKVICPSHRPSAQKWYADRNIAELLRSLAPTGKHVASWSTRVSENSSHEDQAWAILSGLNKLIQKFPDRLDLVCRLALKADLFSLKALKQILNQDEDLQVKESELLNLELPLHENVRGPDYYSLPAVSA